MKNSKRSTTTSLIVLALFLIPAPALSQNVIEQREKLMESNLDALKLIRAAAKQSDYATLQAKGKEIVAAMDKVPDLFPKGSLSENSNAVPEIWEKWDEFREHARKTRAAAEGLVKAAAAQNNAQVQEQVKAIGSMTGGACGGCHLSFNKKRMKKE
jgi:cytochrome c556